MPKVERQTPNQKPTKKSSILDRIQDVADMEVAPIKMNVYGRNGTGKTTFACTFPKPLLLIGFEDGTRSIRKVPGVKFFKVEKTEDVFSLCTMLEGGDFNSAVVDTATSLQDLVLKELLGLDEVPVQLAWGTVSQHQYRERSEKTKELLRKFLELEMNVVILAQEKNHSAKDGEGGGDSDLIMPFVASSIGDSACGWLNENVDFICQTFAREHVEEGSTEVAGKKIKTRKKTDKIEFCLRTQRAHPIYAAKIRADRDDDIPEIIVDPSYEKIAPFVE